jgi:hypothetical protein
VVRFLIMAKDLKFQREQVKKLRSQEKFAYEEASIYTVLLDLVDGNGLDEVFMMLHNVATDLKQREDLQRSGGWRSLPTLEHETLT